MPRQARVIQQKQCYHIISRGNNRQALFCDEQDFHYYLRIFSNNAKKYQVSVFHYCLMNNHTHLLMRSDLSDNGIARLMHALQTSYAGYYHKKYGKTGHVFENRFKNYWIGLDSYLLECGRYIERNPVRAGMVAGPEDYPWSSYRYYALGHSDKLLTTNPVFMDLGDNESERRSAYVQYVQAIRVYESIVDQFFEKRTRAQK